jgi:asparagine synthase (glutamine-hydrolysing)
VARIAGILSDVPSRSAMIAAVANALGVGAGRSERSSGHATLTAAGPDADQAVASRGGRTVVIDGVVFNAREHGGRSAAEIVLDLAERRGFEGALAAINGNFAVALYDEGSGRLWLGRDRVGIKPLYYASHAGTWAFASRPDALLALPGVSGALNQTFSGLFAGSHYRAFDNDPHASPFAAVSQLPAAHLLEIAPGSALAPRRYWQLGEEPEFTENEGELAGQYAELLRDAVRLRLDAARTPAFTLSGGMDSSSVLGSAARITGAPQPAYSSVYQDPTFDESAEIRSMLAAGVVDWHPISIGTPDVFAVVDRMVRAHGEPVATATWLSHFLLAEQVSADGYGAIFGGLGGDELNAGEYEYFFFHFADLKRAGHEDALAVEVERWAAYHDHPIYRKNAAVAESGIGRLVNLAVPGLNLPDRARLDRYAAAVSPDYLDVRRFEPIMDRPFTSYLKNRTYQDIFRETAPCCLRAEDRHAAAFGLEHFDPFFDYRLLEFMFRVPGTMKIRGGVTKILLREAMKGTLPEETRTRIKKTGWNAPAHVWFTGAGLDTVRDLVASRAFRERGIYDPVEVDRLVAEHADIVASDVPRENHMMFLWQLVNLELWLRSLD